MGGVDTPRDGTMMTLMFVSVVEWHRNDAQEP